MSQLIHCAYLSVGIVSALVLLGVAIARLYFYKPNRYRYSLVRALLNAGFKNSPLPSKFLNFLRLLTLGLLVLAVARPQLVDPTSEVTQEGIDIVVALDVSGSMTLFDDLEDQRSRITVALEEARKFIDKRVNDQIGLVLFANDVVSRVPLTADKNILDEILQETAIGTIDYRATKLGQALIVAAQRLQNSHAKSKIIILITDGAPSPDDIPADTALAIAKKLGIKIYTVGIGGDQGGYMYDPMFGLIAQQAPINKELLRVIAKETGGAFFEAKNPTDMKKIYDTIDTLEKSMYQTPLYNNYYELIPYVLAGALSILFVEYILTSFFWVIV